MTESEAYAKVQQLADEARPRGWVRLTISRKRPPGGREVQVMPGVRGELQCVTERMDGSGTFSVVALVRVDQLDRWLARHVDWRAA